MRKAVIALIVSLTLGALAYAHEGHVSRIMGTVTNIHKNHLEVEATNGKTFTIILNDKTRVLKGKAAMKIADVVVGGRVVVTATEVKGKDGRLSLVANKVNLGIAAPTAKK